MLADETLEQVLTEGRGELPLLRKRGQTVVADALEEYIERIANAAREFLTFISERDAMLRSDHTVAWLRARYPEWERLGHARRNPKNPSERQYRRMIIPLAAQTEAARANARDTARAEAQG